MNSTDRMVDVRRLTARDRAFVWEVLTEAWAGPVVAMHDTIIDASTLPGFVAILDGRAAGVVTYQARTTEWAVVTLNSVVEGRGVGGALMAAVTQAAREAGVDRVVVTTTNDNVRALRFFQRLGWDVVALRREAVTRAREQLKPTIPLAADGIPLRHELDLELRL